MYRTFLSSCLLLIALFIQSACAQVHTLSGGSIPGQELDAFIRREMDSLQLPGLSIAVINDGKIVFQRALGLANTATGAVVDSQSVFEAASLSKPVFSYFVLQMVDKGMLQLDTPLYKYMPYPDIARDERYKLITARMVLCHQTGFPNWRYFEKADSSLHVKYGDLYLKFTPGTRYAYSGEGFHYLAQVVAQLNGRNIQTLDGLFRAQAGIPAGMRHSGYTADVYILQHKVRGHREGKPAFRLWPVAFPNQDSTWFGAAGGLHTEAGDYARFLITLMEGQGLKAASLREMFRAQVQLPKDSSSADDEDDAVGLGIFMKRRPYGMLYEHGGNNGNFQSHFMINPGNKNGYVFFTNCEKGDAFNKKLAALLAPAER